jgi:hypothetical protein
MKRYFKIGLFGLIIFSILSLANPQGEESLFTPEIINSPQVQKMFSFIEKNREKKKFLHLPDMKRKEPST